MKKNMTLPLPNARLLIRRLQAEARRHSRLAGRLETAVKKAERLGVRKIVLVLPATKKGRRK